jgi:outer membrane protein assembly factor BamB
VRSELERIEIPAEHDARLRTWAVVRAAYTEREPVQRRRSLLVPAFVAAAVLAVVAAAASPPGRAVIDDVREVIGIEEAAPAVFSLPAPGRVLLTSGSGAWIASADGSKRFLGPGRDAAWSPFGRYVAVARANELVALEPDGDVRWTLARPDMSAPAWGGSETDTRIAYRSGDRLRVVAGDGTGDRLLARGTGDVRPAWRPGAGHVLTYATRSGEIVTVDTGFGRVLWRRRADGPILGLEWSSDGRRLLVRRDAGAEILRRDGQPFTGFVPNAGRTVAAAFRPASHAAAHAVEAGGRTQVLVDGEAGGLVFSGPGRIDELAWSPDGRWLLLGWRASDQWVFVRPGARSVEAASDVSAQFRSETFPTLAGWCCASSP